MYLKIIICKSKKVLVLSDLMVEAINHPITSNDGQPTIAECTNEADISNTKTLPVE